MNKEIGGDIAFYGLADWWFSEFSPEEQSMIVARCDPLGSSGQSLIEGELYASSQSAAAFLTILAGWFNTAADRPIAQKILAKAESLLDESSRALDVHFSLNQKIEILYKDRQDAESYRAALQACRDQIDIAPQAAQAFLTEWEDPQLPSHRGYKQLAIVLEKEGSLHEAIDICRQAQSQGWAGDWEKRIQRCTKKLAKA